MFSHSLSAFHSVYALQSKQKNLRVCLLFWRVACSSVYLSIGQREVSCRSRYHTCAFYLPSSHLTLNYVYTKLGVKAALRFHLGIVIGPVRHTFWSPRLERYSPGTLF
jgi:hypothetical protein